MFRPRLLHSCLIASALVLGGSLCQPFGLTDRHCVRADFVMVTIQNQKVALPGNVQDNGRTITYTHPSIGVPVTLPKSEAVQLVKTPTMQQLYSRMANKAGQNADGVFQAGLWALKKGLPRSFDDAIERTLKIDPNHAGAKKVQEVKAAMDAGVPADPKVEQELRQMVNRSTFRFAESKHFAMLHDTAESGGTGRKKKNLSTKRLDLLEQVYNGFILLFAAQGVDVEVPKEKMKVLLFNDFRSYRDYVDSVNPAFTSPSGFWDRQRNVCVFFAGGGSPLLRLLTRLQETAKKAVEDATKNRVPNLAQLKKDVVIYDMMVELARDNEDLTVTTHEATHQLAASTGLFPRHVMVPDWVREGLATYFEIPSDSSWGGFAAVNQARVDLYHGLEPDTEHCNVDFIVGDQMFEYANSIGAKSHGNAQSWALTHYLMETHIKELVDFYQMLGDMPPDVKLNPQLLTQVFEKAFGNRKQLNTDWRNYMRTLPTDLQLLLDEGRLGGS